MSSTSSRLQIATRIHFLLLREIGQGVDIERMLQRPRYARDVLLVCDACPGTELFALAQQYRQATPAEVPAPPATAGTHPAGTTNAAGGHAPQANDWSRPTSGFGVSRPMEPSATRAPASDAAAPVDKRADVIGRIARWWHR